MGETAAVTINHSVVCTRKRIFLINRYYLKSYTGFHKNKIGIKLYCQCHWLVTLGVLPCHLLHKNVDTVTHDSHKQKSDNVIKCSV